MLNSRLVGRLDARVAVVTGAGRGLGRAHALALAAEGAAVVVNDVDAATASVVVEEIEASGGRALADGRALESVADGRAVVEAAVDHFGLVDILVNNAGVSVPTDVADLDDEAAMRHFGVHVLATMGATGAALTHMVPDRGGLVINTVSGHAFRPSPGSAAYAAAKGAVYAFTLAAAAEAPRGIAVTGIAPVAYTNMSAAYFAGVEDAPVRLAPEHVARFVVSLCTRPAHEVHGRVFRVEGVRVGEYRMELDEEAH